MCMVPCKFYHYFNPEVLNPHFLPFSFMFDSQLCYIVQADMHDRFPVKLRVAFQIHANNDSKVAFFQVKPSEE